MIRQLEDKSVLRRRKTIGFVFRAKAWGIATPSFTMIQSQRREAMFRCCLLSCFLPCLVPVTGYGWGTDGHIITSRVAEAYLTPATRAVLKDIFDDRSFSDVRICTWADQIRRSAVYDRKYMNHPTWHYINIEIKEKQADFMFPAGPDHVLGAIERFRKDMVEPTLSKESRKEALMFVIHFVEDFHQPLHTCHRNDDRGGNLQPIRSCLGQATPKLNLHSVWDTSLVDAVRGQLTNDDYAKRLIEEIKEDDRKKWLEGDLKGWIWESHMIGVQSVYRFADGKELPKPDGESVSLTEENYVKQNRPIVRDQLKKAGVRLAKMLNDAFDAKKEVPK
jgi:nuclease S1